MVDEKKDPDDKPRASLKPGKQIDDDDEDELPPKSSKPAAKASPVEDLAPAPVSHAAPPLPKRGWGEPLARLDKRWTKVEAQLCAAVLVAEIFALCIWILLKGMAAGYTGGEDKSGLVLRGLVGAVVLGMVAHKLFKPKDPNDEAQEKKYAVITTVAVLVGLFAGRAWANLGADYSSNFLNWMQTASSLTLIGGLRGAATRLTLWLALLGASLATAQGKHINVDVVMRFLPVSFRVPVAVLGWLAAATMCLAGVWGFFDHIAIADFHAPIVQPCPNDAAQSCDVSAGERITHVKKEIGKDLFLLGRQISLDFKTIPKVLTGQKYNEYFGAKDWNAWVDGSAWQDHYPADAVAGLKMPDTEPQQTRLPIITIPGSAENVPELLVKDLNFIFPFGLFMIALRFILRSLLALSGHVRVDPDAAHGEEDVEDKQLEQHGGKVAS
jgi:TRAP-type C4-dicarboxylate transport system permease small subunit